MGTVTASDFFGKAFSYVLAIGVGAVSVVIVCQSGISRAGTDITGGWVMAALAVVAVMYSMGSLVYSRRFEIEGRHALRYLFIAGLVVSESYIVFNEGAWFKQHVMVSEARSHIEQIKAKGDIDLIDDAQSTLEMLRGKKLRDEREINAAIDNALAEEIDLGHGSAISLAKATKDCTDKASNWYPRCRSGVLALREELASAQAMKAKVEQAKMAIGTSTVNTRDVPVPANAGAILVADISGISEASASHFYLGLGLVLLACFRVTVLPILVSPPKRVEPVLDTLASVTLSPVSAPAEIETDLPLAIEKKLNPHFDPPRTPTPPRPRKSTLAEPSAMAAIASNIASAMSAAQPSAAHGAATGATEAFYAECTKKSEQAEHPARDFWTAYRAWCMQKNLQPVREHQFRMESAKWVAKAKGKRGSSKNRSVYRQRALLWSVPAEIGAAA